MNYTLVLPILKGGTVSNCIFWGIGGYLMTTACCLQTSGQAISNFGILARKCLVASCNVC